METAIPIITADSGEIRIKTDKEIDVKCLNEALLMLPAKTYLGLYHKMQEKVLGYSGFCGCGTPVSKENEME